jgi:hypothetical protein
MIDERLKHDNDEMMCLEAWEYENETKEKEWNKINMKCSKLISHSEALQPPPTLIYFRNVTKLYYENKIKNREEMKEIQKNNIETWQIKGHHGKSGLTGWPVIPCHYFCTEDGFEIVIKFTWMTLL